MKAWKISWYQQSQKVLFWTHFVDFDSWHTQSFVLELESITPNMPIMLDLSKNKRYLALGGNRQNNFLGSRKWGVFGVIPSDNFEIFFKIWKDMIKMIRKFYIKKKKKL